MYFGVLRKRPIFAMFGLIFLLVAGLEALARWSGATDFPIYQADPVIGYIPSKGQSGSFLNKNEWIFNELHMGGVKFSPGPEVDTLLVGDSIVLGGNPISQEHRLGPQLARRLGAPVWPISAGSWSIINELTYLRMHPEVVEKTDRIVFVFNGGDLIDAASHWRCERHHPRSHPWSAVWYLLDKNVFHFEDCETSRPDMTPPVRSWRRDFEEFLKSPSLEGKSVYVVLYPDVNEIRNESTVKAFDGMMTHKLQGFARLKLIKLDSGRGWAPIFYRDGIHPSANGNVLLAKIIAEDIYRDLALGGVGELH